MHDWYPEGGVADDASLAPARSDRLRLAEEAVISARGRPQQQFVRPKIPLGKKILGSFLESTRGGRRIGERMLGEEQAWENFALAKQAREQEQKGLEANVLTLREQHRREAIEPGTLALQQANIGKAEQQGKLAIAQAATELAKRGHYEAMGEKSRRPTVQFGRPGAVTYKAGELISEGDPDVYGRAAGFPFGPISPGAGVVNRKTGQITIPAKPKAAAGATAKALQVEHNKSAALISQKERDTQKRKQIAAKWKDYDTTSKIRKDGSPNPFLGAMQRELDEQDRVDAQAKNLIQRSYENELNRIGEPVQHFEYPPEGGIPDANAMQPAQGEEPEEDIEALRQGLGENEIMMKDPTTNRYFAVAAERLEELLAEGFEEVP